MYRTEKAIVCDFCNLAVLPDIIDGLDGREHYEPPAGWVANGADTVHICPHCMDKIAGKASNNQKWG